MKYRVLAAAVAVVIALASPAPALTPQARTAALDRIADLIQENYVFKDKAAAIAAELRSWKADPEIAAAGDENRLADLLTTRLRKQDRHFYVFWHPGRQQGSALASPAEVAWSERHANYGFDEVKRLPGNIGYIRMGFFADFDVALTGDKTPAARQVGEGALALVASTDAVIFDLRSNGGGSPAMIDLMLSAFFGDKPVLLNKFYDRAGDKTEEFTTLANFRGLRRPDVPVFVLTSGRTASAAEEFSYDVQTQKRGRIVGETTYGGANPGQAFDAGDGFGVFISTGTAINPITGKNWEGIGVQPDIAVPAADALSRAHAEALRLLIAQAKPGGYATELQWALEQVEAKSSAPLKDFVGLYGERQVILKDNALFYARGRAQPQKLVALGGDAFGFEEDPGTRLRFGRGKSGQVENVTVAHADGDAMTYQRDR